MSRTEFIALMAMLFSTIAFSIDAMLPALPEIGAALSPDDLNRAQLVVTSFVLGMGFGTLFSGPLSDTFGRKPVILAGLALYMLASLVAAVAQSLEVILAARVVQGLGASGPRIAALAVIRDLYAGRGMARIMSFVLLVFSLVPALAPSLGALILLVAEWRAIFGACVVFALVACTWMMQRLPETLPAAHRRPFRVPALRAAIVEILGHPIVRLSIAVQCLCLAMLFSMLSSTQQIFDITFGQGAFFALWFGGIAAVAASSSFVNASLVERLGMWVMVTRMLWAQVAVSLAMIALWHLAEGPLVFAGFVFWQASVFFQAGLTIGNVNAIAMEPMGHIAGMAASVIGSLSTVAAVLLAVPVGLMFDGTPRPLALGIFAEALLAVGLMYRMRRAERAMG